MMTNIAVRPTINTSDHRLVTPEERRNLLLKLYENHFREEEEFFHWNVFRNNKEASDVWATVERNAYEASQGVKVI